MKDLRFFYFTDTLAVEKITDLGGTPRKIRLDGQQGLDSVADVKINGASSPLVTVTSPTSLEVQVPNPHQSVALASLEVLVLSSHYSGRTANQISLDLGAQPERVEGFELLVQTVLRKLLQTPGSNRSMPGEGVGLRRLRGAVLSTSDAGRIRSMLFDGVQRVSEEIVSMQSSDSRYSLDERLRSLSAGSVDIDVPRGRIQATIHLTSESGVFRAVPLVL